MGGGIKYGQVGTEEERGSGYGQRGLERPKRGKKRAHLPGPGKDGMGGFPHLGFSPAGLGLGPGPARGPHRLGHRPFDGNVAACFCQNSALSTTCPVPASGLSRDRISTTPAGGAATRSLYGQQSRTNYSGSPFHWRMVPPPLTSRPHPLTRQARRAQAPLASGLGSCWVPALLPELRSRTSCWLRRAALGLGYGSARTPHPR